MRRRLPSAALDGVVTDICGYRETAPGYFHNIEYASLTVPLVTDATGIGPKTLSRIVRFNRALGLSRQQASGWADIAADCGYADQAHLAREFRDLAGETPTTLSLGV
ncbi:AraC family transcriptional regulator [Mesorhizobium australicum]|uniref:helix-turn-helix domain-containing protein n=1 Tax=Mesorhizobium australicum TaxID=536018 RepID=UPI00333C47EB